MHICTYTEWTAYVHRINNSEAKKIVDRQICKNAFISLWVLFFFCCLECIVDGSDNISHTPQALLLFVRYPAPMERWWGFSFCILVFFGDQKRGMGRLNVDHLLHKLTSALFPLFIVVIIKYILEGETVCHGGACWLKIKLAASAGPPWVEDHHRHFVQHLSSAKWISLRCSSSSFPWYLYLPTANCGWGGKKKKWKMFFREKKEKKKVFTNSRSNIIN